MQHVVKPYPARGEPPELALDEAEEVPPADVKPASKLSQAW